MAIVIAPTTVEIMAIERLENEHEKNMHKALRPDLIIAIGIAVVQEISCPGCFFNERVLQKKTQSHSHFYSKALNYLKPLNLLNAFAIHTLILMQ